MQPTTGTDTWSERTALEVANEPQWIVWTDLGGEAEWVAGELAVYAAQRFAPPPH